LGSLVKCGNGGNEQDGNYAGKNGNDNPGTTKG